jgi:hypothetical protein
MRCQALELLVDWIDWVLAFNSIQYWSLVEWLASLIRWSCLYQDQNRLSEIIADCNWTQEDFLLHHPFKTTASSSVGQFTYPIWEPEKYSPNNLPSKLVQITRLAFLMSFVYLSSSTQIQITLFTSATKATQSRSSASRLLSIPTPHSRKAPQLFWHQAHRKYDELPFPGYSPSFIYSSCEAHY